MEAETSSIHSGDDMFQNGSNIRISICGMQARLRRRYYLFAG